jgi:hypothetical protein
VGDREGIVVHERRSARVRARRGHDGGTDGKALMSNKRQQTMAKMTRERTVRERRAKKLEKKQAARAEKKLRAAGEWPLDEPMLSDEETGLAEPDGPLSTLEDAPSSETDA